MSVVITTMDAEYACLLIEDRAASIQIGTADAPSPPLQPLSEEARRQYLAEVQSASEVFLDRLSDGLAALEDEGLAEYFPTITLDAMIQVLVAAWGPAHVRNSLAKQWKVLRSGMTEIVSIDEPRTPKKPPSPKEPPAETRTSAPVDLVAPKRRGRAADRFVEVFSDADVDPETGHGAWAVVMKIQEKGGRSETREISAPVKDSTGRTSSIRALIEALGAIDLYGHPANILIEVTSAFIVKAMDPQTAKGARLESEKELWDELDHFCARHIVEWRHVAPDVSGEQAETCDRLVRRILTAGGVA